MHFDIKPVSAQVTNGDLEKWWKFAARFSGTNHPFKPGGGQFLNQNQPSDLLCLTCTGDSQPGSDPNTRQLPTVGNRPILIPVFVAGASNREDAISELGNNVTKTLMINGQAKNPVEIDAEVHGVNFPANNPFDEPAVNNPNFHTVGFWFKIPSNEVASVNTIEFGGTSSTFSTSVKYRR